MMKIEKARVSTGIEIEYSISGMENNDTLLFIHGLGANLRQFEMQQQYFEKDYRVLLVSLRGHGGSSPSSDPVLEDYTARELALDVQALLQHLGIRQVHVVGNSLGGLVGYELLALDPDMFLSLTTFGTTPKLHVSGLILWILQSMMRLFGSRGMARLISKTASKDKTVGALYGEMYRSVSKDALLLISKNIGDYDYTDTIRMYSIPMMLIKGGLDSEINKNLEPLLEVLRENPNFEFVELVSAGHLANLDKPDEFNDELGRFLMRQR